MVRKTANVRHPPAKEDIQQIEIAEYLQRDDVRQFISKANEEYYHWDDLIYKELPEDTEPEELWYLIKYIRSTDYRLISISEDLELKFDLTDWILEKLHMFDKYLGGMYEANSIIPEDDKRGYLVSSIMEEAIASSQLEGATSSREEAKKMLRRGDEPQNKDERMILNNYKTIQKIKEVDQSEMSLELLKDIHESISKDTLDREEYEGQFREGDMYIHDNSSGEVLHTAPDPDDAIEMLEDLCEFANADHSFVHPIIKASILHFSIGYIHPFQDGNGRTARAIFYWYLVKEGYERVEYLSISRIIKKKPAQYRDAYLYTETDENDLTYFIRFQLKVLDEALEELEEYIEEKMEEKEKLYSFQRLEDINERQIDILSEFAEDPQRMMTIKEHANTFNISDEAARLDLNNLVEKGILGSKRRGKRKVYFRSENFDEKLREARKQ